MQNGNSIELQIPYVLIMVISPDPPHRYTAPQSITTISQEFNSYATAEIARKHLANELKSVTILTQGVFQK